ncbi:hypothetical protein Bca4012_083560 [Brassica carinata]
MVENEKGLVAIATMYFMQIYEDSKPKKFEEALHNILTTMRKPWGERGPSQLARPGASAVRPHGPIALGRARARSVPRSACPGASAVRPTVRSPWGECGPSHGPLALGRARSVQRSDRPGESTVRPTVRSPERGPSHGPLALG